MLFYLLLHVFIVTELRGYVLAGDIDAAVNALQAELPAVLEKHWRVGMRLQAQKFTEILRKGRYVEYLFLRT